jgi:hypothetical protein
MKEARIRKWVYLISAQSTDIFSISYLCVENGIDLFVEIDNLTTFIFNENF